ncbi:MAG: ATP-dependent Clp protease proteolytic subunit [Spirochaetales bacterium]|nr:ATP-dependent Clp protease proteolytic subunit [Spirochaetales bacterium]
MKQSLFSEYISKRMTVSDLEIELQRLIGEFNRVRETYMFVYASDVEKATTVAANSLSLSMGDYHIIHELLRDCGDSTVTLYLETPGGSGEAAEEIVEFLHSKFDTVDVVVAGEAKSAGTLMALSADEIFMTESGSLGPIDAQVRVGRSTVSAFDYVQWIESKREEAKTNHQLNPVDATMIAQISPGEFELVYHAQQFAVDKVREWLPKYKFKHWHQTETKRTPVTDQMKEERAAAIAKKLIDHSAWRSHGRSLKTGDLESIGLRIEKLEDDRQLCELVYRMKTVIRLIFGGSTHYKLFTTADEKIFLDSLPSGSRSGATANIQTPVAELNVTCPNCGIQHPLFARFGELPKKMRQDLEKNALEFPSNNKLVCQCGFQIDLSGLRNNIEKQVGRRIVDDS